MPQLNEPAPQFTCDSTLGSISLSDYKGKWVVLFSHPADFTPVCTTEFIAFANAHDEFEALNTQLIGLSLDSVYSHIAWLKSISEDFNTKVKFPIITDTGMEVAKKYGMIHEKVSTSATVRCLFIINPAQKIRAMLCYPMNTGRVIGEIKRVIQSLQVNEEKGLATPEGWNPGENCILPPPRTQAEAEARLHSYYEVTNWYFSKTKSSVESLCGALGSRCRE